MTRTYGLWKNPLSIVAALALAIALVPVTAFATTSNFEDIPATGDSGDCGGGGCTWTITADGKLSITKAEGGNGILPSFGYLVNPPWYKYAPKVTSVSFGPDVMAGASLGSLFSGYAALTSVNMSNLDTSAVTDMSYMFSQSPLLKTVTMKGLVTSSVSTMGGMFQGCSSLESADFSNLSLRSVTNMGSMFTNCTNLKSVSFSNTNTPSLANTMTMFRGCQSLTTLDLSGLNTTNANEMFYMFYDCPSLNEVTLGSNFSFYGNGLTGETLAALPEGKWFSEGLENFFSAQQIAQNWGVNPDWVGVNGTFTRGKNKIDISDATITLNPTSYTYDGNAHTPAVTVTYQGDTLVEGTDYTLECTNNIDVGKNAAVVITGVGYYDKTKSATFEINPASIANATVIIENQTYTGKALEPAAQVKIGDIILAKGTDYTIAYENNTSVGTAKVTIAGIGNYTGTLNSSFEITATSAAPTNPEIPVSGEWKEVNGKWWYGYDEATQLATGKEYPSNEWATINGERYYFDEAGWMVTGWQKVDDAWYYLKSSGAMAKGWLKDGSTWYYLDPDTGIMQTGWQKIKDTWYYLKGSGAMVTGWKKIGGSWYYLDKVNGDMKTGWLNDGGTWYYLKGSGAMATGWKKISGSWYFLDKVNGDMKTGWLNDDGAWYYLQPSGAMVSNGWVSNYWLQKDGSMATDAWVDENRYYVDARGVWVPDKERLVG